MQEPFKDLIVLIPGILGSRLVRRDGKHESTVWDLSVKGLPRALLALAGGSLALESPDREPDDGVEATDLYSFQLLPGLIGVEDYQPLVLALQKLVTNRSQFITFPYDWRASNRFAAARLQSRALGALDNWKRASGNPDAKLWLVCHSMGGLVARYFCEHLDGARHTRAVVTFGTPHRGATKALGALSNGLKFGPIDVSRTFRSLPSVYELLPLYEAIRLPHADPDVLDLHRVADFFGLDPITGADAPAPRALPVLPGLDRTMVQRALQFHAAIREPAERRVRDGAPSPYQQRAFFNRRQPTLLSGFLTRAGLEMYTSIPEQREGGIVDVRDGGDGTVPSFSAMPIEWKTTEEAIALTGKHAAMQCEAAGMDTLLNWLQPMSVATRKGAPDADRKAVSLEVPSAIALGEPLKLTLAAPQPTPLTVSLTEEGSRVTKRSAPVLLPAADVPREMDMKPDRAGVWRVTVQPQDRILPAVSDWVYVFER